MEKQSQSLLEQRAERIVKKGIREDKIAGACVAVLHDQEQLLFRAYGMADKERQIPMRTDSIFRMFSMTKPVTAVVFIYGVQTLRWIALNRMDSPA